MLHNSLRSSFPYRYEVLEYGERFDIKDSGIASFFDVTQVVAVLSGCLKDLSDMRLMAEMLSKYDRFDPITCWEEVQVLHAFADLVYSGRIALRVIEPEKRRLAVRPAEVEEETPAPKEEPKKEGDDFVGIELVDPDGEPIVAARVQIAAPGRAIRTYRTDKEGKVFIERICSGTCTVLFHDQQVELQ